MIVVMRPASSVTGAWSVDRFFDRFMSFFLHHGNLLLRQPVQHIHQPVYLPVGDVYLALEVGLVVLD